MSPSRLCAALLLLPSLLLFNRVDIIAGLCVRESGSSSSSSSSGGDQHILVFDAGSTGTRVHVFKLSSDSGRESGLRLTEAKEKKVSPGLSAYANAPDRLRDALKPLMEFARSTVPDSEHGSTTAIVRATAGLRLLTDVQQRGIIRVVAEILHRSNFRVPAKDDEAVRVITGQEEAKFGWAAVNFLAGAFDWPSSVKAEATLGVLDMGGGSTQISFVPEIASSADGDQQRSVYEAPNKRNYSLHLHSYLGLGLSEASLRMFGYNATVQPQKLMYSSPCLNETFSGVFSFGPVTINVTGSITPKVSDRPGLCVNSSEWPLLTAGVHKEQLRSKGPQELVAVSGFYYVSMSLKKLGHLTRDIPGNVTVGEFTEATKKVCAKPPADNDKYLPYVCLNAQYIVTLLRVGYGFSDGQKMLITNTVKGKAAGWPLGVAIYQLTCTVEVKDNNNGVYQRGYNKTNDKNAASRGFFSPVLMMSMCFVLFLLDIINKI